MASSSRCRGSAVRLQWPGPSVRRSSWKTRSASSPSTASWLSALAEERRPRMTEPMMCTNQASCPSSTPSCASAAAPPWPAAAAPSSASRARRGSRREQRKAHVASYWKRQSCGSDSSCSLSASSSASGSSISPCAAATAETLSIRVVMYVSVMRGT